jgi:hypothetical protein
MPRFVGLLFMFIALMGLAYVADYVVGSPSDTLSTFVGLDLDQNLSTWFSSLLWFGAAALSWVFAVRTVTMEDVRSWSLLLLPLLFLAFSIDEVARLHEATGVKLDEFLLDRGREETLLRATGVWIFVLGIPLLIALALVAWAVSRPLREHRSAAIKIGVGMIVVFTGALGVEALSNLVDPGSISAILQVLVEETLEMVGATTVVWGCYELVRDSEPPPASAK